MSEDAKQHWTDQYKSSEKICSHAYWYVDFRFAWCLLCLLYSNPTFVDDRNYFSEHQMQINLAMKMVPVFRTTLFFFCHEDNLMRGHQQLQPFDASIALWSSFFFPFFCKPVCVFLLSGAVTARKRQWVYSVKLVFGAGGTTFCVDQCSVFGMSWRKCSPRSVEPM